MPLLSKKWKEYNKLPEETKGKLKPLNHLSGSEWTQLSRSINTYGGPIAKKRKVIGAAFPISLAKHIIRIYTKQGNTVLDPFVGVGTTLDAAQLLGRNGIGFEINPRFYELAKKGVDDVDRSNSDFVGNVKVNIIQDTCMNLTKYVEQNSIDLILTSPPYWNLLNKTVGTFTGSKYSKNIYTGRKLAAQYSLDSRDFGNMSWKEYCTNTSLLMRELLDVAKPGSFNVWVVRDFRDMEGHNPYVNLHSKIISLATDAGWVLIDIVIWNQTRERRLVKLGGKKSRRFYFNIGHSFLVIFRKNIPGEIFSNES